jgi:hypothetical protein
VHEHLRRCLGIREGAVAGRRRNAEEVGERGEADAAQATLEQAPGQRGRAERRLGQAPAVAEEQLPFEEALVEPGVVRDEQLVAGEGEEPPQNAGNARRAPQLRVAQAGEAGDGVRERDARVHERLKRVDELQCLHANRAYLTNAATRGREPGRLEVEDHELGFLQGWVGSSSGQRDRRAGADDPAVAGGDLFQQGAREAVRDRGGGEERAGRLDRRERAALLERVHQSVERVERELHLPDESEHMFVWQVSREAVASPRPPRGRATRLE